MKFVKFLIKVIAIIIIAFIIMESCGMTLPAFMEAMPGFTSLWAWIGGLIKAGEWGQLLMVGFGALAVADPAAAADTVKAVAGVVGDAVSAVGGAILSSPIGLLLAGLAAVWLLSSSSGGSTVRVEGGEAHV